MLNVIDLFCGAGGFSWGFYHSGYNLELAIDNDPIVCETYNFNFTDSKIFMLC